MNRYQREARDPTREEIKVLLSLSWSKTFLPLPSFDSRFFFGPRRRRSSREIDSVREKGKFEITGFSYANPFHRLPLTSFHPPRFQLATRFIDYILAATITVFPKFSKKMSERKSIGALFNSDLFLSRIKSNRVFETVISRAQRPGQKGFRRLFSIYSLFVPRGRGRGTPPFSGSVVSASPSGVPEFHISRVEGETIIWSKQKSSLPSSRFSISFPRKKISEF